MHTKLEHLLLKSLTTLEVKTYDLVVHMGPGHEARETGGHWTLKGVVADWVVGRLYCQMTQLALEVGKRVT